MPIVEAESEVATVGVTLDTVNENPVEGPLAV
jgi:hypothetical protein